MSKQFLKTTAKVLEGIVSVPLRVLSGLGQDENTSFGNTIQRIAYAPSRRLMKKYSESLSDKEYIEIGKKETVTSSQKISLNWTNYSLKDRSYPEAKIGLDWPEYLMRK